MALFAAQWADAVTGPPATSERMVEWTIQSAKKYAQPFNDVDVDVVFERNGVSWRVPTFWRGGNAWTVRFAPPEPGEYLYHLESTDRDNPDLNGRAGKLSITAYHGNNPLLRHGALEVSSNKRFFVHADGTPFFWLGSGGVGRTLYALKSMGFTTSEIITGYMPYEEWPSANEGGEPWKRDLSSINPQYFDYTDRRIADMLKAGLVPEICGGWFDTIGKLGMGGMKKHWRYILARYGAYPVIWRMAGEIYDPPAPFAGNDKKRWQSLYGKRLYAIVDKHRGEWSEVAAYIRKTDPYHHPLTVHEINPDERPLQQESLTDFQELQPAHFGTASIAIEVAQLDLLYSRADVTKPIIVAEINGEGMGMENSAAEERAAFWLAMLNGAAGINQDGALVNQFTDEKKGLKSPILHEISIGALLLRSYPWWEFQPHPEWVSPRGTTLFEARRGNAQSFHMDLLGEWEVGGVELSTPPPESEWHKHNGNFYLPYAAGIPRKVRFVYVPMVANYAAIMNGRPWPTVLRLEAGVSYHAYLWAPASGVRIDLGDVETGPPGPISARDDFTDADEPTWNISHGQAARGGGYLSTSSGLLAVLSRVEKKDLLVSVSAHRDSDAGLILRYHDDNQFVAMTYSAKQEEIHLVERREGVDGAPLGQTGVGKIGSDVRLSLEARNGVAIGSITDGVNTYSTPIVDVQNTSPGLIGLSHGEGAGAQSFSDFEVRDISPSPECRNAEQELVDARGASRGKIAIGSGSILLDAYRPPAMPDESGFSNVLDWLLVLEANSAGHGHAKSLQLCSSA